MTTKAEVLKIFEEAHKAYIFKTEKEFGIAMQKLKQAIIRLPDGDNK